MNTATIYVIDDDASMRESLSSLLRAEGLRVELDDSPFAFLARPQLAEFACIVLDVRMPGMDGLSLQEKLNEHGLELPIVFISGHGGVPDAVRAMKGGAVDFLTKPFEDFELLNAIQHALSHVSAHRDEKSASADLQQRYDQLTPREKEILSRLVEGKPNKIIAWELGVTESTVKVHRHNVMSKMQLRSLPELALAFQRIRK